MGEEAHRRARVVVLLGYDQDPVRWRERHARGETSDVTPYGYELAQEWFDVEWGRSHPESALTTRVRRRLAAALGYDIVHAWRNRRVLRGADVVWTHTEREHLAVAALPRRRPRVVVAQSVWLWDQWGRFSARRRRHYVRLLSRQAVEITLSPSNADVSNREVPGRRVMFVPFGTQTAKPEVPDGPGRSRPLVLAPGNDVHRDWQLLRDVASELPMVDFRVATRRPAALALSWPPNADVRPADADELRRLYRECAVVAIPLTENVHASGVTVGIEALGANRALVATRVGGLDTYFDGEATLVSAHDVAAFSSAVEDAARSPRSRSGAEALVHRGLRQRDYVLRFVHLTRALLGGPWDPSISVIGPVPEPDLG